MKSEFKVQKITINYLLAVERKYLLIDNSKFLHRIHSRESIAIERVQTLYKYQYQFTGYMVYFWLDTQIQIYLDSFRFLRQNGWMGRGLTSADTLLTCRSKNVMNKDFSPRCSSLTLPYHQSVIKLYWS